MKIALPDAEAASRQLGRAIETALDGLPADQREAVWLVDGQGLKFGEAAEVLGLPPGTVASRVAEGTTVTVRLPAWEGAPAPSKPQTAAS